MSNPYEMPLKRREGNPAEKDKIQEARSRIEKAGSILLERYEKFKDYQIFIEYICRVENFFAVAEINNWDVEATKRDLFEGEKKIFSRSSYLEEDILNDIHSEFKLKHSSITQIDEARKSLLDRYANLDLSREKYEDCCEFINYLADIFEISLKVNNPDFDSGVERKNLVNKKIIELTQDGLPKPEDLNKIYGEFEEEVEKE